MIKGKGAGKVNANLKKLIEETKKKVAVNLIKTGMYVVSKAIPLTPVEYGVLRNSFTTRLMKNKVRVSNTAEYAIYVHENLENKHPRGGEAQFLQKAIIYNITEIKEKLEGGLKV